MQNTVCAFFRPGVSVAFLGLLMLGACTTSGPPVADAATAELDSIAAMETKVFGDSLQVSDLGLAYDLASRMAVFADSFPTHPKAGAMLFRSADLCQGLNQGSLSVKRFERFRRDFPKDSLVADALFMEGHVAETVLADTAMARKKYTEFMATYPSHPFAPGAQFSLDNMGKTEEQMIQDLLKKGQEHAVNTLKGK